MGRSLTKTGWEDEEAFLFSVSLPTSWEKTQDRWPPWRVSIENCCDRNTLATTDGILSSPSSLNEEFNDETHLSNNCHLYHPVKSRAWVLALMRGVCDSM